MKQPVAERVGFHFDGQYVEAEVRGGLPAAIYVDEVEIEPTLDMIRAATVAVRQAHEVTA